MPLLVECERVLQQVACAPQRSAMTQRILTERSHLDAALAADDFEQVLALGMQLQSLQQESAQLPLSEEDYLTLADRHAALVLRVVERCTELALAKEFAEVTVLGAKLSELRAAALPVAAHVSASNVSTGKAFLECS
jgi:hypothetical protein